MKLGFPWQCNLSAVTKTLGRKGAKLAVSPLLLALPNVYDCSYVIKRKLLPLPPPRLPTLASSYCLPDYTKTVGSLSKMSLAYMQGSNLTGKKSLAGN